MSDDVFRGMHPPKKNHFALCSKTNLKQGGEKKQNFSLFSVSSPLFFSLFSLFSLDRFLTTKTSSLSQLLSFSSFEAQDAPLISQSTV